MDRHLKGKDAAGQAWSVCHRFALVAVAGELATEFGILPWDKGDATKAADICFAAWLDERGHLGLCRGGEDHHDLTHLHRGIPDEPLPRPG